MGRVCAIEGCPSGRNCDIKRRRQHRIRQVSLFEVPKCENARRKWCQALVTRLELGKYICEDHFNERDIKKQDEIAMRDGTIAVIPRLHYLLNQNAVLTQRPQKQQNADIVDVEVLMEVEEQIVPLETITVSITRCASVSSLADPSNRHFVVALRSHTSNRHYEVHFQLFYRKTTVM